MAFGKFFLLPVIGGTLFGWLTYALKTAHNFAGPLFAVSLLIVFLTFVRDNFPRRGDLDWLLKGGGLLSGARGAVAPLQRRREAGLLGRRVLARHQSSSAPAWCSTSSSPAWATCAATCRSRTWCMPSRPLLMMAMFLGHIYIGTIGMRGAYRRCAPATSTKPGPASTTRAGTRTSRPARSRRSAGRDAAGAGPAPAPQA